MEKLRDIRRKLKITAVLLLKGKVVVSYVE